MGPRGLGPFRGGFAPRRRDGLLGFTKTPLQTSLTREIPSIRILLLQLQQNVCRAPAWMLLTQMQRLLDRLRNRCRRRTMIRRLERRFAVSAKPLAKSPNGAWR